MDDLSLVHSFLPHDASTERSYEIAFVCPSVRPSVTIRYPTHTGWNSSKIISRPNKVHVLVDARHGQSGATWTPPKLGWNIGCELELNCKGDNARLLIYMHPGRFPRPVLLIAQALGRFPGYGS